jgi:hypothetical protein
VPRGDLVGLGSACVTRGRIALLLAVALGVWALAFLRGEPSTKPPGAAPASAPSVAAPAPPKPAAKPAVASQPAAAGPQPRTVVPMQENDEYRKKLMEQSMAQRQENDERYESASSRWLQQGRMEPWASAREQRLRDALQVDRLDHLLLSAECRADLCRLEISAPDSDTAMAFRSSVAFMNEVGPNTAGGMVGSGPDRALVIFAPRRD